VLQFQPEVSDMKKSLSRVLVLLFALALITTGCNTATSTTTTTTTAVTTTTAASSFSLTSSAFSAGGTIPINNAEGTQGTGANNQSVPLAWTNAPSGTVAFALRMLDTYFSSDNTHWLVVNIPSATSSLAEGASPSSMPAGSTEIANDYTGSAYVGPYPPTGDTHNYQFTLYALSATLDASAITTANFAATVSSITLGTASLTGSFTGR